MILALEGVPMAFSGSVCLADGRPRSLGGPPTALTGAPSSSAGLAFLLAIAVVALPPQLRALAVIFVLGGIYVAAEETLEDSLCVELSEAELQSLHQYLLIPRTP